MNEELKNEEVNQNTENQEVKEEIKAEENTPKKFGKFTDTLDMTPERKTDETFEQYKIRRAAVSKLLKAYGKGKLIFNPNLEVRLPEITKEGNLVKDSDGNIIYTNEKRVLGPYVKKFYGKLDIQK